MKKIFENWNKYVLNEAMKGPEDLPDDVYVLINTEEFPDMVVFSYVNRAGNQIKAGDGPVSGFVAIAKNDEFGGCLGAWVIDFTTAEKGWGPLLYDVAIEWATMRGKGLMPDRVGVSDKAYAVWDFYLKNRSDVEKTQLDSMNNDLTPDEKDNCMQTSSNVHSKNKNIPWHDAATSKVYSKKSPEMIKKLDSLNKLVFRETELYEEKIVGGLADFMSEKDFDQKALRKGMKHELEHTYDPEEAKEIAMDHLAEDPKYYEKLEKIEEE
jgi:hypothetical protein